LAVWNRPAVLLLPAAGGGLVGDLAVSTVELRGPRGWAEGELHQPVVVVVAVAGAGPGWRGEGVQAVAAGTGHDLADAGAIIGEPTEWVQRAKALIDMVVAIEHQVGVGGVQGVPEVLGLWSVPMPGLVGEAGVMPVGQGTRSGVGLEVGLQPADLRGVSVTGWRADGPAVGVQRDDVPGTEVKGVVALVGITSQGTEAAEVAGRPSGRIGVVVLPGDGRVLALKRPHDPW
jgi:hypothetical protein